MGGNLYRRLVLKQILLNIPFKETASGKLFPDFSSLVLLSGWLVFCFFYAGAFA